MSFLRRAAVLAACLASAVPAAGCCSLFCSVEAPESPTVLTRDTPEEAVRYLVEALQGHRVRDIYESLHPELRRELGGFSLADFTSGFSQIEDDVDADARLLESATVRFVDFHPEKPGVARVEVRAPGAGGMVALQNMPDVWVDFHSGRFPESRAVLADLGDALAFEDGALVQRRPVPLAGTRSADMSQVRRVVYRNNWLVRAWRFDPDARIRLLGRRRDERRKETGP